MIMLRELLIMQLCMILVRKLVSVDATEEQQSSLSKTGNKLGLMTMISLFSYLMLL